MSVARKIQPGPQVEALPFMLGGMLGDPTLEGVSATANVGVALISHGEDVAPVLVVQLPEGSPLRESLPNLEMQLRDSGGWTFALPKDYPMTLVDGKEKELIAAVSQPRRYDVELTADAELLANAVRGSMDAMMAESPEAAKEFKPLILVAGYSAYPRTIDFEVFGDIARESGAKLLVGVVQRLLHLRIAQHRLQVLD